MTVGFTVQKSDRLHAELILFAIQQNVNVKQQLLSVSFIVALPLASYSSDSLITKTCGIAT